MPSRGHGGDQRGKDGRQAGTARGAGIDRQSIGVGAFRHDLRHSPCIAEAVGRGGPARPAVELGGAVAVGHVGGVIACGREARQRMGSVGPLDAGDALVHGGKGMALRFK